MDSLIAFLLAVLQGFTEFLPISSSGHLIIPTKIFGFDDQGLAFDAALHTGSLGAVLIYFRTQLLDMYKGCRQALVSGEINPQLNLAVRLGIATVPITIVGFLLYDFINQNLRSLLIISTATILFAIPLAIADRRVGTKNETELSMTAAFMIGLAQIAAIIPGASRSGIVITVALFCGLHRIAAAKFAFLLAIPVILGATLLNSWQLVSLEPSPNWWSFLIGTIVSGLSAYICIHYFLRLINRIGMLPFVLYRLLLGGALFIYWYSM